MSPQAERESSSRLKPQVYVDERPAEHFDRYHAWARGHRPDWVQDLIRLLALPICMLLYRTRVQHPENVPGSGPAIVAPNHFSAMDHFFCGVYIRRRVRFMAKSQLFKGMLAPVMMHGGAFPVRRGQHDEEAIVTALHILRNGGVIVIYPEGGRSRTQQIGQRARPGVGRLALESGAPVIPVAIEGSVGVHAWKRLRFPKVHVRYGAPLRFDHVPESSREQQQAVADEVLDAVHELYDELSAEAGHGRQPRSAAKRPVVR